MPSVLEARGIVKRYGDLLANDGIDLSVEAGEIHAVMGENGAGKSTLMSILYGLQQPDEGSILLDGKAIRFRSPVEAIRHGLGMVHQAFKLFDSFTVWENVVYGEEPRRGAFIDRATARRRVAELAGGYGLAVDPDARVGTLPVGVRQRIEILKALYRDARVLILDEPTAVLTPQERDALFQVMRMLVAAGRSILFVTHKLHEVMAVTDRVTVLRDGRVVTRMATAETSPREIVRAMTGRNIGPPAGRATAPPGGPLLEVTGLRVLGEGGKPAVEGASFVVHAGEVVGIAGVAGNGQSELIEAIMGLRPVAGGRIIVAGQEVTVRDVTGRRQAGLAYIPEDRAITGTAPAASATDNLAMGFHRQPPIGAGHLFRREAARAHARALIARFGIKVARESAPVRSLSGGNMQKLVVARELTHDAPVLVAEQPTRGVDVGATEFIHGQLAAERAAGHAILLVSAELTEIMGLSDRILVMFEGRILADIGSSDATEERLGLLMAGRVDAAA